MVMVMVLEEVRKIIVRCRFEECVASAFIRRLLGDDAVGCDWLQA